MKDIHSHLLPGIDDGSKSIDESIKLLKQMEECGVTDLVLTPHYIVDSKYNCKPDMKRIIYKQLLEEVRKNNINIKLYLGNEIFLDDDLLSLVREGEVETINNSRYLLIEFPMVNFPTKAINVFSELIYSGYKIILAHPERYLYIQKNIKILDEFKEMGVLFQGNYESLCNKYGYGSKKTLIKLLKKGYISFLAGDIHHEVNLDLNKLEKKLKKYIDTTKIEQLLNTNIDKVINDMDL